MLRRLTILVALWIGSHAIGALPPATDPEVSVVVSMIGDPLAAISHSSPQRAVAPPGPSERKLEIARQQDSLEAQLNLLGGQVTARFDTLLNAVVVRIPESVVPRIRSLPGVRSLRRERMFRPLLASSVPFIGAPGVWTLPTGSGAGEGIRIAIIDSGIDYLHADLGGAGDPDAYSNNDPTRIEAGTFPTAKVIGGYDFVGDDYDSAGEDGDPNPVEDRDPLDPAGNGHGTHVAGIAAGNGVLTNGLPYTGAYTASLDFSQFQVAPGVAPRALLYAYKVFGKSGSTSFTIVARALERALDPNQDGSYGDRVDVANLSLGSPFGLSGDDDPEIEAVNRLSQQGVIVVIAAGNNGNTHYVCGSPGVAARAITVANSLDDGAAFSFIRVSSPAAAAGDYAAAEASFTPRLATHPAITAPVVYARPEKACEVLSNSADLAGHIALVDRGTCFFIEKVRRLQGAGAVGVIVVNNVDGTPFEMGGQGDSSDIRIPAVMISRLDGLILKAQLDANLVVTLANFASVAHPELADQINESSSRGPSAEDGHLKPDVSAPGTGILSAKAGDGTGGTVLTGTSMASPHVAGGAALLRQARPTWSVEDIKAALMNTAVPTQNGERTLYPESRAGSGRIRLGLAMKALTIARGDSDSGDVSLSFGAHQLSQPLSLTRNVRVVNHGAFPASFRVSAHLTTGTAGVMVVPSVTAVTVPAQSSLLVPVRLDLDPAQFQASRDGSSSVLIGDKPRLPLEESAGEVWFQNDSQSLRVPWHVVARATASYRATATTIGVGEGSPITLSLPTRGSSAHGQPLVSVFQLGFEQTPNGTDSGDLLAAGAATDFSSTDASGDARVFFGMATAGEWISPQYELVGLEVEIDLNNDGIPEYILFNSSGGNLNGQGFDPDLSNDALMTLVFDTSKTNNFLTGGGTLNVLDPSVRDTAPYHNRVAILSTPIRLVGLGKSLTQFKYRVTTTGLRSLVQTETPWIEYDVAHPMVDATPFGLLGSPIFDEGRGVRVTVDRAAAIKSGFGPGNPLRALLLHQHDASGQPVDLVSLVLDSGDSDHDGLSDLWEMEWLGDLDSGGNSDSDRDGISNAAEFAAGTNPLDIRLLTPAPETGALRWLGTEGRAYTIERAPSLQAPFAPILRHLPGVNGTNSVVDPTLATGLQTGYYRVLPE